MYLIALAIWLLTSGVLGLYRLPPTLKFVKQAARASGVLLAVCALFAGALYFTFRDVSRLLFAYFFLASAVGLVGVRLGLILLLRKSLPQEQRILIVGTGPIARTLAQSMRTVHHGFPRLKLLGFVRAASLQAMTPCEALGRSWAVATISPV